MKNIEVEESTDAPSFWITCFQKNQLLFFQKLESDSKMWETWTKSDKRYLLVCYLNLFDSDGIVRSRLDCHISSDDIESLRFFWKSNFTQERYNISKQHFIVDIKERKAVEFLWSCF